MARGGSDDASRDRAAGPRLPYAPAAVAAAATVLAVWLCAKPWLFGSELTPAEFASLRDSGERQSHIGRYVWASGRLGERIPIDNDRALLIALYDAKATTAVVSERHTSLPASGEQTTFHGQIAEVDGCFPPSRPHVLFVLDAREGWFGRAAAASVVVAAGTLGMFAWTLVTWLRASRK
ncbi:MAG: hypothetical protein ACYTKD_32775 [Planctomycetota bacterium]